MFRDHTFQFDSFLNVHARCKQLPFNRMEDLKRGLRQIKDKWAQSNRQCEFLMVSDWNPKLCLFGKLRYLSDTADFDKLLASAMPLFFYLSSFSALFRAHSCFKAFSRYSRYFKCWFWCILSCLIMFDFFTCFSATPLKLTTVFFICNGNLSQWRYSKIRATIA